MKARHVLSALLIAGILSPAAALASQTPQKPKPAVKALRQSLAGRPAERRALRKLSPEQKQQLRTEVRDLMAQTRTTLQSGTHTRGQVLRERIKLRAAIRKAVRRQIRGGS